jgi:uncharacterized protein YgiM (DUF1202 family)
MFRLTAVLLAGLYATYAIWGQPPQSDVSVARSDTLSPTVPALVQGGAAQASTAPDPADLSALSDEEALELALAATEAGPAQPEAQVQPPQAAEAGPDESPLWYVTGTRVNLRSGPSSSASVVGGVSLGDRAEILSDPADSWVRIRTQQGLEAWIFARFLSETPA